MIHLTTDGTFLCLGNSFNVKTIKPVPIALTEVPSILPGNVPNVYNNKFKCTQEKHWYSLPHFDNDHSDVKIICAYPLVEDDQEIGEVIK
jgi:hypothetical protein